MEEPKKVMKKSTRGAKGIPDAGMLKDYGMKLHEHAVKKYKEYAPKVLDHAKRAAKEAAAGLVNEGVGQVEDAVKAKVPVKLKGLVTKGAQKTKEYLHGKIEKL